MQEHDVLKLRIVKDGDRWRIIDDAPYPRVSKKVVIDRFEEIDKNLKKYRRHEGASRAGRGFGSPPGSPILGDPVRIPA